MDAGWNFVMPNQLNQSVAVEALALSLASSFEVVEADQAGQPTSVRTRGSGCMARALGIDAAEAEFTRCWALAVAADNLADEDQVAEFLELEVQAELILAVGSYMEVNDLGYVDPLPWHAEVQQLQLELEAGG